MTVSKAARTLGRGLRLRRGAAPGAAPGTLRIDLHAPSAVVRIIAYSPDAVHEEKLTTLDALDDLIAAWPVVWINVDGLGDESLLRDLAERFNLHRLAVEDVVHVGQRSKVEAFDSSVFIVARMVRTAVKADEQVAMFLTERVVLTFQEMAGDCFDPVRQRIRDGRGRIRKAGTDYLTYALLDSVIDAYFPALETFGDRLEALELGLLENPQPDMMEGIHLIKRELLALRRAVWPMREAIGTLMRDDNDRITDETRIYLRDCYDHVVQVIDMVETYRELASSQMDLYLSSVGQRTNEIMKVLTMFAAIFIPLSFIAGLYGMNFQTEAGEPGMPELTWRYGYPMALGIMVLVSGGLLWYFKRKGWIGAGHARSREREDEPTT